MEREKTGRIEYENKDVWCRIALEARKDNLCGANNGVLEHACGKANIASFFSSIGMMPNGMRLKK
ncbi:MAG: hypothetical protein ABFS45_06030 [Pseudomonadota bacterium]